MEPTLTKPGNTNELNTMYKALFTYLKDNTNDTVKVWISNRSESIDYNASQLDVVANTYFTYKGSEAAIIIPYHTITAIRVNNEIYKNLNLN